jgi:membrane associated rhomboid family serine protease
MFTFILKLIDSLVWPLVIVVFIWLVFFLDIQYSLDLNAYGMHPKRFSGLMGIFTMPFLHGDFDHLFSNSVPLLLSMGFIYLYFKEYKVKILLYNFLLTGILLWFLGEEGTNHIGASGLVYAYIFFLVVHAFITKNKEMLAASFVLIFLYGSLIYGLFPEYGLLIGKSISWEGHLSGAISGLLFAILYRKVGPQQRIYFEDEEDDDDDDLDDEFPYWESDSTVHYHYRENE